MVRRSLSLFKETCEYFSVCGGGNPSNKFSETTRFDVTETEYCRIAVKATCDAMLNHLERKLAVSGRNAILWDESKNGRSLITYTEKC